jgi:hypothetical protein
MGLSSSGTAAFTMAWFHPELYLAEREGFAAMLERIAGNGVRTIRHANG